MNQKRLLIIIGIVVLLAIVGIGFYFLFSSPQTASNGTQSGQFGTLPSTGNQLGGNNPGANSVGPGSGILANGTTTQLAGSFGVISNNASVLDYFASPSNVVSIIEPDGEVIQVSGGNATTLNSLPIQNIMGASFSYDGTKILVTFGDPSNPQASIFDIPSKTWLPMSAGWQSPVWSPTDYRIAYAVAKANGTEAFASFDVSKPKNAPITLLTLHAEDMSLAWPDKTHLVLATKPSASDFGSTWLFNLTTKALAPISTEAPGLETTWSGTALGTSTQPLGLQFSVGAVPRGGHLQLVSLSGTTVQHIAFLTLPTKCVFTSTTSTVASVSSTPIIAPVTTSTPYLYCAVPRDQDTLSFSILPDDYNQMALFTSDDIYRINLADGVTDTLFSDATQNLDVSNPKLINNTLFFVNRYDQKLYGIQLAARS